MNSPEYWRDRAADRLIEAEKQCMRFENEIKEYFRLAEKDIENQIGRLYLKYADDNKMTYSAAMKYLTNDELEEFKRDLQFYTSRAQNPYFRKEYRAYLQALSTRARVRRLEEIKTGLHFMAEDTYANVADGTVKVFDKVFKNTLIKTSEDIYKLGSNIDKMQLVPEDVLNQFLANPWSGKNFSEKIWGNIANFETKLDEILTKGLVQGKSDKQIANELKDVTKRKYSECLRLVRTETNYIENQTRFEIYKRANVKKYRYIAVLDNKTSKMCADLDDEIIDLKDAVVGYNYPPLHPN